MLANTRAEPYAFKLSKLLYNRLYIHHYTSSTSPLATSCCTTEYGTNEMWPFSISKAVPLDNIEFDELV